MYRYLIIGILLSFKSMAIAGVLELKAAILEGEKNSPAIQKAESQYRESKWRKLDALGTFLPTVTASATYLTEKRFMLTDINFGGTPSEVPQILPTSILSINAQLPLFEGGAGILRYQAQKKLENAAKDYYEWVLFKTAREILLQYYRVAAAMSLKSVAEQNQKALEDHLRDVRLFKKAGLTTHFDVLKVEVQASEAESEVLNADDNILMQRSKLNVLLGVESDDRTVPNALPELPADILANKKLNFDTREDIAALINRVESNKKLNSASNRFWSPRVGLVGQYQYYNNRTEAFYNRDDFRDAYYVGFQMTWNLFEGFKGIANSQESKEVAFQSERDLKLAQLNSKADIDLWSRKLKYFSVVARSRKSDVEKSTESVRLASQGKKFGTRTNSDFLDAEGDLYKSLAGRVNAQMGQIEALINLELASGQKLYSFF